ncbi:MAG: glucose-6-phosphate 1-epimerase [Alphaproteobacteria bacterium]|jgi:glucose-6-phosphate 1-epimerase
MQSNPKHQADMLNEIESIISEASSVIVQHTQEQGLCLAIENQYGSAVISMFGGHILSYVNKSDNKERLWLSKLAIFDGKTPIRGGIPICWPWFGSHATQDDYPSHGYARTQMYALVQVEETSDSNKVINTKVTLRPFNTKQYGYSNIDMKLVVTLSDTLTVDIITINKGEETVALTQALHAYFLVDNISQIILKGANTLYDDKLTSTTNNDAPNEYRFTQEVDRIHAFQHAHYSRKQTIKIIKSGGSDSPVQPHSTMQRIEQSGHDSTVVWNPWKDKSKSMNDMENNGYRTMLCIEAANTANAEHPLLLVANQIHKLSQKIF